MAEYNSDSFILTDEMKLAVRHIKESLIPLFITGKAGAGKTTFLKYLVKSLEDEKNVVVTASTGIAAINAGGVTLHSLFKIPLHIIDPLQNIDYNISKAKVRLIRQMDILIIDEISMVRPDIIDYVDKACRQFRRNYNQPFGGVKVVLFGDLFQLPPVLPDNEARILYRNYKACYFFVANVFKYTDLHVLELSKIFRQSDQNFINILNNIRNYQIQENDIYELAKTTNAEKAKDYNSKSIHLCSLKRTVDKINTEMLGEYTHTFEAKTSGKFDINMAPCDKELKLKVGARVMITANDHEKHQYCNGSLGNVENIEKNKISVRLDDTDEVVYISRYDWEKIDYVIEGNKVKPVVVGKCTQFPITLAWAITIHKSQGLTFDEVTIHAKNVFAPGQIYVALSRCRTLEGITTDSFITPAHIYPDQWLIWFEYTYRMNRGIFRFIS